jgi:hypothetical protein
LTTEPVSVVSSLSAVALPLALVKPLAAEQPWDVAQSLVGGLPLVVYPYLSVYQASVLEK